MPNFNYTRNIPFSTHNPSVDQPDMQTNTNSTDDLIEVNHYSFNDNNGGYHKPVNIVNSVSTPVNPAGVGSTLYSVGDNLAFTNPTLSTAGPGMTPVGIQLTKYEAPPVDLVRGSSFLPGGIVIQWGSGVTDGSGVFNDTLIYPYSVLFCAFATAISGAGLIANAIVISPNVTTFVRNTSNSAIAGAGVSWLTIGIL